MTEVATNLKDTTSVTVNYTEVAPTADNDSDLNNLPGTNGVVNVIANDTLSDGSPATLTKVSVDLDPTTPAIEPSKTVAGEGTYVYNPATGEVTFSPLVTFTGNPTPINYVLTETATGLKDTASITVTYIGNPIAVNDTDLGNIPGIAAVINVIANDTLSTGLVATPATADVDLDPSTPAIDHSKVVAGEGTYVYNPATGEVTFTPESGFTSDPTPITYNVVEKANGLVDPATITIDYVLPIEAIADVSNNNVPGVNAVLNIVANDTLSDGSPATPVEVTADLNPATAGVDNSLVVPGEGTWTYNPTTGDLTFNPETGFSKDPTPISYILTETATGLKDTTSVTVNYTEVAPIATNDSDLNNLPGTNGVVNVIANDTLSDGSPATLAKVTVDLDPTTPAIEPSKTVAGEGTYVYNPATGEVTFTPLVTFTGNPTPINYVLTETATGLKDTASITVTYIGNPIAVNDTDLGNIPGAPAIVNVIANDILSTGLVATPATADVDLDPTTPAIDHSKVVAGEGTYVYNPATGEVTFTPESGFTADPTPITYNLVEIANGLVDPATITIDYVLPIEAIADISNNNVPGVNAVLNIVANDTLSDGSPATPAEVTVDLNPATAGVDNSLTVPGEGTWTYNPATGDLTFDPEVGFTTDPTPINYILTEVATNLKDTTSVTVNYTEVAPTADNDSDLNNLPGTNGVVNVIANDTLSDGSPATLTDVTVDLDPTTPAIETSKTVAGEGTYVYNPATGEVTFTPLVTFTGNPTPINYVLTETATGLKDTASVTITYFGNPNAINDLDVNNTVGTTAILNVIQNDTLSTGLVATPSTVDVDLDPATPAIEHSKVVAGQGTFTYLPSTGEVTFTPESGFTGDPTPINYKLVEIANGLSDIATITIDYNTVIDPVNDQSNNNTPGVNAVVNIIANDTLSDGSPATPSEVIVDLNPATPGVDTSITVPGEGTWTYNPVTGELVFDPQNGFTGNPTPLTYKLTETLTGNSKNASVTVQYLPAVPPVALNDQDLDNLPNTIGSVKVILNDTLGTGNVATPTLVTVDLDPTTISVDTSLVVAGQGTFTYIPSTGFVTFTPLVTFSGNPTPINYVLTELGTGLKDTASIAYTYLDPVFAINDTSLNNVPGINATLNIVANDTLSDGNPATAAEVTVDIDPSLPGDQAMLIVPNEGTWLYNTTTGVLTFNPQTGFTTDPTDITYVITETANGLKDSAVVHVEYTELTPVANPDNELNAAPQTILNINVLTNDKISDNTPALTGLVKVDLEPTIAGIQTSLLVVGEGIYNYDTLTGVLKFTPVPGFYANPTPLVYGLVEKKTGLVDTSIVNITYLLNPQLELVKTGTLQGPGYVGDTILYSFTVINTGNVPVTGIFINDAKISPTAIALSPSALAPGGVGVAMAKYALKAADVNSGQVLNSAIASGNAPNAVVVTDTSDNGDPSQIGGSNATVTTLPIPPVVDVKLTSTTLGNCGHMIGDTVSFQIKVFREDTVSTSVDVVVKDSLGTNFQLISATVSEGTFNGGTGIWNGITLAKGDTATLTINMKILTNMGGLTCNEAWVDSLSLLDIDSNPGNKIVTEDDIARACASVPVSICPAKGESVLLEAELGHATYQWYKNGVLIPGAINSSLSVNSSGSYTTVVDGNTCPNGNCCPIDVQENCPCPTTLCIPITIKKN